MFAKSFEDWCALKEFRRYSVTLDGRVQSDVRGQAIGSSGANGYLYTRRQSGGTKSAGQPVHVPSGGEGSTAKQHSLSYR